MRAAPRPFIRGVEGRQVDSAAESAPFPRSSAVRACYSPGFPPPQLGP